MSMSLIQYSLIYLGLPLASIHPKIQTLSFSWIISLFYSRILPTSFPAAACSKCLSLTSNLLERALESEWSSAMMTYLLSFAFGGIGSDQGWRWALVEVVEKLLLDALNESRVNLLVAETLIFEYGGIDVWGKGEERSSHSEESVCLKSVWQDDDILLLLLISNSRKSIFNIDWLIY